MHYYTFNIGDYQSHTAHLSEMEDLAYRRMLDWCYLHEKSLPPDVEDIARLIRMRSHSDSIATVLREFFDSTEDGWIDPRARQEIAKFSEKSEKARQSAKVRWDANALPKQSEGNAKQEPRTKNHKPIDKASPVDRPLDVPVSVWDSFLQLRKTKKAPVTSAALEGIKREANAAGWTLEDALQECCVRGWQGFKSDWVEKRTKGKSQDDALVKIRQDEKLSAPMPDRVREMLKIKRIA